MAESNIEAQTQRVIDHYSDAIASFLTSKEVIQKIGPQILFVLKRGREERREDKDMALDLIRIFQTFATGATQGHIMMVAVAMQDGDVPPQWTPPRD